MLRAASPTWGRYDYKAWCTYWKREVVLVSGEIMRLVFVLRSILVQNTSCEVLLEKFVIAGTDASSPAT